MNPQHFCNIGVKIWLTSLAALVSVSCGHLPSSSPAVIAQDFSIQSKNCVELERNAGLDGDSFQFVNWNIYKGKKKGWDNDIKRLSQSNTLIALQEAAITTELSSSLGQNRQWDFAPGYINGNVQTGVLSSFHISPSLACQLRHIEPWLGSPKATLITRYPIGSGDQELMLANIHAINFTFGTKAYRQQIGDMVAILSNHNGPIILAGDFNTWSSRRLKIIERAVISLGLVAVKFDTTKVKKFGGQPLDHVFYRGLKLQHQSVVEVKSSDHNILVASFSI